MREVVCALCDLRQPVGESCIGCGVQFGAYTCLKCCFFEDDTSKQQFHCAACGICRVGGVQNFFHCHTCGCCYATSLQVHLLLYVQNTDCLASSARHPTYVKAFQLSCCRCCKLAKPKRRSICTSSACSPAHYHV